MRNSSIAQLAVIEVHLGAFSASRAQGDQTGGDRRLIQPLEDLRMRIGKRTSANREVFEQGGARGATRRLSLETRKTALGTSNRLVVRWGPKGARQQVSFPATDAGQAAAEAFYHGRIGAPEALAQAYPGAASAPNKPLTVSALWDAFKVARSPEVSAKSLKLYADAFKSWRLELGASTPAAAFKSPNIGKFRTKLDQRGLATATIRMTLRNIKLVYNWATNEDLLPATAWQKYEFRVAQGKKTQQREEFQGDEFIAIWSQRDPESSDEWRSWVGIGLLGVYGNRASELLGMKWNWITDDHIRIPAASRKNGKALLLALFPLIRRILDVARRWRKKLNYRGPYVLFPGQKAGRTNQSKTPHYTIQSLINCLHTAERAAGIEPIPLRATHGFRRGLVGDLVEQTGDATLAVQAIGDTDLRMLESYLVLRPKRIAKAIQERTERMFPE